MQKWLLVFRVLGIGWLVAASILLGVAGGQWLDNRLGTRPVFLIIGLLLGLSVAVYGVYVILRPLWGDNQEGKGDS